MKTATILGLLAASTAAFPYRLDEIEPRLAMNDQFREYRKRMEHLRATGGNFADMHHERGVNPPQGAGALPLVPPPFDAALQHVSTTGEHKWVAPKASDSRGMCPGLNALANHGYLPHNGYGTIEQYIYATNKAYGMAVDLGAFLGIYGAIVDGDGTKFAVGSGPHQGLGGSHGNYESDSSVCRPDLNQYGNNYVIIYEQLYSLYNRQSGKHANYNLEVLRDFRRERFYQSVHENPWFTYNPFAGIEVSQAAFTFAYRFMANKSAEYPEGVLNREVFKSFFALSGPDDNLKWTFGHERIPDNFYKRHPLDEYSIPYFELDILYFAETVPEVLEVGCNINGVNTYDQIAPALLVSGANAAEQLAKNPVCFASQFAINELPLFTGLNLSSGLLGKHVNTLKSLLGPLDCGDIGSVNQSALAVCPGLSLYAGPNGTVARGAIQNY